MKTLIRTLLIAALAGSSANAPAASTDREADIDARLEEAGVPGVAIATIRNGSVRVRTHGSASPGGYRRLDGDTRFEAASLSKTVFAAMFLDAVAAGELSLDAALLETQASARVSDRAGYVRLTPRLVLSHQSGLPNWAGDAADRRRKDPLEFKAPPGSSFGYSGEAFELLRAHAEKATGLMLDDWFRRHRDRFGMPNSGFVYEHSADNAAVAVGPNDVATRGVRGMPGGNAAASLVTTARDYGRFLGWLLDNEALLARALTPQVLVERRHAAAIHWGLGWGIYERADGRRIGFHWGDNFQFKAFVAIDPSNDLAIAYFANGVEGLRLVDAIVEPVVGELRDVRDWLGYEDGE